MSPSIASEPQDRGEDLRPASGPPRRGAGPALDRKVLEEALERALIAPDPARTLSGEDWKALQAVVHARKEEPFSLDPIAIELVEAVLRSYFRAWKGASEALRNISREIAGTLFEDPVFHQRMRTFWLRLIEVGP